MKRDVSIDIAKAITIILMVVGHCDALIPLWLFTAIFSFHLPLFFFFSGFFFNQKRSVWEECQHSAKALLRPYIITGIIAVILSLLLYSPQSALQVLQGLFMASGGRRGVISIFPYNAGPIWFLFALFWTRVLFQAIYKWSPQFSIIIAGVIGMAFMFFGAHVTNLPFAFGNGASALFFYAGGYAYRLLQERYGCFIEKMKIPLFIICMLIWIVDIKYSYLNIDQYYYSYFPLPLLGAFAGIWVIWRLASHAKSIFSSIFSFIGKHTLDILCCHTIAFKLCKWTLCVSCIDIHPQLLAALLTIVLSAVFIIIKVITTSCVKC